MPDVETPQVERARWIACLGQADPARLETAWAALSPAPPHRWLRKPETGLVMLRGRAGGDGQAFNLGEMTMTRAAVLLESDRPVTGFGYVAGRDHRHAELAALFDALLQEEDRQAALMADLIEPLEAAAKTKHAARAAAVAPTRVDFTTMVRGDG
jgi:alpha-D-ribose 1-methylphosphonate 5-triphosphate synthase subunit PhnG